MDVKVKTLPEFDRRAKRLIKKYKSLKTDLQQFVLSLMTNPLQGKSLGGDVYKVRLAIASKGAGKSGGARVLTFSVKVNEPDHYEVILLTIYDKSEIANVTDAYTKVLVEEAKDKTS